MSDGSSKIGGSLPPLQVPDTKLDADESFLDDIVGAESKRQEAAQKRAAEKAGKGVDPAKQLRQQRRVNEASTFSRTRQDNEVERREKRFRTRGDKARGLEKGSAKDISHQGVESLARSEEAVGDLMHEIYALMEQIDVLGGLDAMDEASRAVLDKEGAARRGQDKSQVGRLAANVAKLNSLNAKLRRAEFQVKQQLQQLLAGGTGLLLLGDPRLTFRRLLSRITHWPRRIRPGRCPTTDEEFDDFIAWVFEPPDPPLGDAQDEYAW